MSLKIREGEPVLVDVRCQVTSCRTLLGWLTTSAVPAANDQRTWNSYFRIKTCLQHGAGNAHGSVAAWVQRQKRAGKNANRVTSEAWMPWTALRPHIERARRTNRTQIHYI